MKYAHTKLHLTPGGGNMWQPPLSEMIALRKSLGEDVVNEVFFCGEIEYQKRSTWLYKHFILVLAEHI